MYEQALLPPFYECSRAVNVVSVCVFRFGFVRVPLHYVCILHV